MTCPQCKGNFCQRLINDKLVDEKIIFIKMDQEESYEYVLKRINNSDTIVLDKLDHTYDCGRGKDNQIVCLSLTVSRQHCIFFRSKNGLYVSDQRSANGIYINGVLQLKQKMIELKENDIIGIGCPYIDATDSDMFAYKLCIKKTTQTSESKDDISFLTKTILNDSNTSPVSDFVNTNDSDNKSKQKRGRKMCDTVVPSKKPRLDNEDCSIIESTTDDCKMETEKEIEIVHVSLKPDTSVDSENSNSSLDKVKIKPSTDCETRSTYVKDFEDTAALPTGDTKRNTKKVSVKKSVQVNKKTTLRDNSNEKCEKTNSLQNRQNSPKQIENVENNSVDKNVNNIKIKEKRKSNASKKIDNQNIKHNSKQVTNNHSEVHNTSKEQRLNSCSTVATNDLKSLPPNYMFNGETMIKMEEELQLTDNDEQAILNCMDGNVMILASPIKLKKVKEEPKTRFSEIDIVNLSDNEDDVFPCSQLFDTGFEMDTSDKLKIKEQPIDSDDDRFNRHDYIDEVILLTDSDAEDDSWLQKLSRSQVMNENDEIDTVSSNKVSNTEEIDLLKENNIDVEYIDNASDKIDSELPLDELYISKKNKTSLEDKGEQHRSSMQNILQLQQNTVDTKEKCESYHKSKITETNDPKKKRKDHEKKANSSAGTSIDKVAESITSAFSEKLHFKSTINEKKIPEIEPPHMPLRRRSSSSAKLNETSTKGVQKLTAKEKKELQEKAKVEEHLHKKEEQRRKSINNWALALPQSKKKESPLTKEEKKILAENRKEKLKTIAIKEKETSKEESSEKKRTVTRPKAKISKKTRSDFLVQTEAPPSTSKLNKLGDKLNSFTYSCTLTADKRITIKRKSNVNCKNDSEKTDATIQNDNHASVFADVSNRNKELEKDSNVSKTKAVKAPKEILDKRTGKKNTSDSNVIKADIHIRDQLLPNSLITTEQKLSCVKKATPNNKTKKRVSFSENIKTVYEFEIDAQNGLKKLTGKDAPIPSCKLPTREPQSMKQASPKLEEFLLRIFMWNPVWLEEQRHLKSVAPVVNDNELHPTLTHYKSYTEYYKTVLPLLLLEIWCGITKEFQSIEQNFKRRTFMCSIVQNSIEQNNIPHTNLCLNTLMLEVLITKEDARNQAHPTYGDLVFFEYVKNHGKGQTFHKVFAYVTNVHPTVLTPTTYYNKDLKNYVKNAHTLLTFTMLTKLLEKDIPVNRVQRLRAVTYLRPSLRMVQAIQYLPNSSLKSLILYPKIDMYKLPQASASQTCSLITKDKLNKSQLEAVLKVTEAVVQKPPKLCFIQGPPGTGKSKVIVNIITQILYGGNRYNTPDSLRILVCAPSNAATDEIVLRLLNIRSTLKENRFKMVRIGRPEMMHPTVKNISVTELAKRDLKKTTSNYLSNNVPLDSVEEEKVFIESRINAYKCTIANSSKMDEAYRKHIQMKLTDMTAKYELLKTCTRTNEINPREREKLQRAAENKILQHADIIACTLTSCYAHQMELIFGGSKQRISVCIVDEATQSCEAETLIPLMLGVNSLVLVGDTNQLPATVLSQQAKKLGLDQSIFSRVQTAFEGQASNPIIMLDTQYRMHQDISHWPNKFFYGGILQNAPEHSARFPFHSYRLLNVTTHQNGDKFSNTNEASFIANMIACMITSPSFNNWDSCITIGVLTPYNNQKSLMQQKIDEQMSSISQDIKRKVKIEVNTVDSFQGQERDVIIMSCVRSQGIGFLSDRQRLCVALTRAKHSLILCANFDVFMGNQMWKSLITDARSRRKYCHVNANATFDELRPLVVK